MSQPNEYDYRGWRVYDNGPDYWPVTGRWRASRFGVGIGHPTEGGLCRMIDARIEDEQRARDARKAAQHGRT